MIDSVSYDSSVGGRRMVVAVAEPIQTRTPHYSGIVCGGVVTERKPAASRVSHLDGGQRTVRPINPA